MTKDEALKLALEALEDIFGKNKVDIGAITAIKEALAQPVQEPTTGNILMDSYNAMQSMKVEAWEQFHEHLVERNFCTRCGKRTADLTTIHTCTPPT